MKRVGWELPAPGLPASLLLSDLSLGINGWEPLSEKGNWRQK